MHSDVNKDGGQTERKQESGEQELTCPENRRWREDGNKQINKNLELKQKRSSGDWMKRTKEAKEVKDRAERGEGTFRK